MSNVGRYSGVTNDAIAELRISGAIVLKKIGYHEKWRKGVDYGKYVT